MRSNLSLLLVLLGRCMMGLQNAADSQSNDWLCSARSVKKPRSLARSLTMATPLIIRHFPSHTLENLPRSIIDSKGSSQGLRTGVCVCKLDLHPWLFVCSPDCAPLVPHKIYRRTFKIPALNNASSDLGAKKTLALHAVVTRRR